MADVDQNAQSPFKPLEYEWKIPTLNKHETEYVCHGFITKTSHPMDIPTSLITLCQLFMLHGLYSHEYF